MSLVHELVKLAEAIACFVELEMRISTSSSVATDARFDAVKPTKNPMCWATDKWIVWYARQSVISVHPL